MMLPNDDPRDPIAELPTIDPQYPDETVEQYGGRVLLFLLREGLTGYTLSDRELEVADHAYPIAVSSAGIAPATVDRLSAVHMRILRVMDSRRAEQAAAEQARLLEAPEPMPAPADAITQRELLELITRLTSRLAVAGAPSSAPDRPADDDLPDGGHLARLIPRLPGKPPAGLAIAPEIKF